MPTITKIYECLERAGVTKSKYDFSRNWLGRCQSYTSAIEASGRDASADALATAHVRLGALIAQLENSQQGAAGAALAGQRARLETLHGDLREHLLDHWHTKALEHVAAKRGPHRLSDDAG